MYRYKINSVEVNPEASVRCRVEAEIANRDVKGARTVYVTFDFTKTDHWKQPRAYFENGDGDEVSNIPSEAISVLDTAHDVAQRRARNAISGAV